MEEGEGRTNVGGGELRVKRARGRKNQICVVELVHARRRRGRRRGGEMFVGAKNMSRIRKRREGKRGGRGGGRGGRGEGREGKGGEGRG